jgi:hypothetical protein
MFEYTGGAKSPLYVSTDNSQLSVGDDSNKITLRELQLQQQLQQKSNFPNPSNGVKASNNNKNQIHQSMSNTLGATGVPPTSQELPAFTNTGYPVVKQQMLYKPIRPTKNSSSGMSNSPRKQQQEQQSKSEMIGPCYAVSCADGLPDDLELKNYIAHVTQCIKLSDPQAEVIDLELIENNCDGSNQFEKREASLKKMRFKCNAGLICCIPKGCSLERWLRAIVEARDMLTNNFNVLGLVDPHEKIPPIFVSCCDQVFTTTFELERYISIRYRKRAVEARNAAARR